MTYAQLVAEIRRKAQGLTPGWEDAFAARHALSPAFVRDMVGGQAPIYPSIIADLAATVGLRLELAPLADAQNAADARLGSLP